MNIVEEFFLILFLREKTLNLPTVFGKLVLVKVGKMHNAKARFCDDNRIAENVCHIYHYDISIFGDLQYHFLTQSLRNLGSSWYLSNAFV